MSKADKKEELFRELADRYTRHYGVLLLQQAEELEKAPPRITPRMDREVRRFTARTGLRRSARGLALVAACLALFLLVPLIGNRLQSPDVVTGGGEDAGAGQGEWEDGAAYDDYDEAVPEDAAMDMETGGWDGAGTAQIQEYPVIPLSFSLPRNLEVEWMERDYEKSVYYLADEWKDDVVLTLEPATYDLEPMDLVPLDIGGSRAYGRSAGDYSLLVFEQEEVRYTMTCKYDINTLVSLSACIL